MSPSSRTVVRPTALRRTVTILTSTLLLFAPVASAPADAAPRAASAQSIGTAASMTAANTSSPTSAKTSVAAAAPSPKATTTTSTTTTTTTTTKTSQAAAQTAAAAPVWGLYGGPGPKGPKGAQDFTAQSKIPIKHVLDFLPGESWQKMTTATWLTNAYKNSGYQLELSVPMLPDTGDVSLAACGGGAYNVYWKAIATQLKNAGLSTTIVRPGWEFNGNWYRWSSAGQPQNYINCFRQLVTSMRSVEPRLTFAWCVNGGDNQLDGVLGYPGSGYVDYVTVDVYDYNYRTYTTALGALAPEARLDSWNYILSAKRGLTFWSAWAAAQNKPFAISEWAMSWRSDGRAGGDNLTFVNGMYDFIVNPANKVKWASYFNSADTNNLKHNITSPQTVFPNSRDRFYARAGS